MTDAGDARVATAAVVVGRAYPSAGLIGSGRGRTVLFAAVALAGVLAGPPALT